MVPGGVAVEPLPSNTQLSVLPSGANVQVSVASGPVTPKSAVATIGMTVSTAEAESPP